MLVFIVLVPSVYVFIWICNIIFAIGNELFAISCVLMDYVQFVSVGKYKSGPSNLKYSPVTNYDIVCQCFNVYVFSFYSA